MLNVPKIHHIYIYIQCNMHRFNKKEPTTNGRFDFTEAPPEAARSPLPRG